jgi:hypothetical protein
MAPGVNPNPLNKKLLNISKTIEIPTPKPYIFMSLVLQAIYPIIRYGLWGHPHLPRNGKLLNISKTIEILTPKPYIFLSLVLQAIHAIH